MQIEVKLYGTLRRYRPQDTGGAPHHPFFVSLIESTTIEQLVVFLSIPNGYVNAAALNNESVEITAVLKDGDKVGLFPPSAGG